MEQYRSETGTLVDETRMSVHELARACHRDIQWVTDRVGADLLQVKNGDVMFMLFSSADLTRARRLADVESMFDANQDVAGLVVDLIEEVERLRRALDLARLK